MQLPLRVRIGWQHPRKTKYRRRTKAARYRRPHHVRRRLHRSHIAQLRWITRHQRRPKVPTPPPRRDERSKHNSTHHPPPRPAIVPPPRPVRSHNHRPTLYQIRQSPASGRHNLTNDLSNYQVSRLITTRDPTTPSPQSRADRDPASPSYDELSSNSNSAKKMSCAGCATRPASGRAAPARCQRRQPLDHAPHPQHTGRCAQPRTSPRAQLSPSLRPCASSGGAGGSRPGKESQVLDRFCGATHV